MRLSVQLQQLEHPNSIKQFLNRDEYKLYSLIWSRFVASQMKPALFDETIITVEAKNTNFRQAGRS